MNRLTQVHGPESRDRSQSACEEALHVGGAAAVKPAAFGAQDNGSELHSGSPAGTTSMWPEMM
jgi:hypothetical protein